MASWMVHLRIADLTLDRLEGISQTEFVMGNIAPDSGLPNEDRNSYTPDRNLSHFYRAKEDGENEINIQAFLEQYFTKEQRQNYTGKEKSFYLGYLIHLLTDVEWVQHIYLPALEKAASRKESQEDRNKLLWAMKADWYDLDFLYLKKHPDFRAFRIYENAEGFVNTYMDIFSPEAFDRRRADIVAFYRGGRENLEREYPYLTEKEAEQFGKDAAESIMRQLEVIL